MCGIIGVFNVENSSELVQKGLELMQYRGYDGNNFVEVKNGTLGHCLHAIVGKVKQPIGRRNYLIANCEIYNWKELNEEFNLNARNDAEVVYELLQRFSVKEVLDKLDGDYACAYYD